MERLGVSMRTMASSTAVRTAEETRVKEPNFLPTKVVATDPQSLHNITMVDNIANGQHSAAKPPCAP